MKKWQKILAIALAVCLVIGAGSTVLLLKNNGVTNHLILNADGSFGGSLNEELYGVGAPKNGEYNVKKSDYYTVNSDYYNMSSTEERVIIPKFSSYQQTMQDSSGLACLLMVLNYAGQDVKETYTELELVKRYEQVNNTTVYGNGTTAEGLINLVNDLNLGYTAVNEGYDVGTTSGTTQMKNMFTECIKDGKFVFVRYQSPVGYGWKLVIGYDDLGNVTDVLTEEEKDSFGDDVIIFAEPYDAADHLQDGYATERAKDFIVWWRNMELNGKLNEKFSYLVVDPNIDVNIEYKPVDTDIKQKLYDIHLPLNPDGTYGGTRDESLYGTITSGRGWWNHTNSNYYKINDFYNMGSSGTRTMLKNYTVLQQTMHSSCGICAVGSVLKYYGVEESYYDLELSYLNKYESTTFDHVNGSGSTMINHYLTLMEMGYESEYNSTVKGYTPPQDTYEKYMQFIRENLQNDKPFVVSTNLGSGHFLTVIGIDDMGTDFIYDDVLITADSCDYWDGYQDGYNVFSAYKFYTQHTNSKYNKLQAYIVIEKKD